MASLRRRVLLILLLITATLRRPASLSQAAAIWNSDSDWYLYRPPSDFNDNGSPLPKTSTDDEEMANEIGKDNIPTLPLQLNSQGQHQIVKKKMDSVNVWTYTADVKFKQQPKDNQEKIAVSTPEVLPYPYVYGWTNGWATPKPQPMRRYRTSICDATQQRPAFISQAAPTWNPVSDWYLYRPPRDFNYPLNETSSGEEEEMANEIGKDNLPTLPLQLNSQGQPQNVKKKLDTLKLYYHTADVKFKRGPNQWPSTEDNQENVEQPTPRELPYPYVYGWTNGGGISKRQPMPKYRPSISGGSMTNLGEYFNRLQSNVRFAEHDNLGKSETQLLLGKHPHPLQRVDPLEDDADPARQKMQERKTSHLLHALRTYRPSQKIRTLVSRNPPGYRGSAQIDPSYMWLGLGK